jgi:glycerophosphoryl diester phosphodiesterase
MGQQMYPSFLVHGHRGSRGTHPENTFPAFEEAVNAGVDFIEIDVRLSRDGVPIVIHDPVISGQHYLDPSGNTIQKAIPVRSLLSAEICSNHAAGVFQKNFPAKRLDSTSTIPNLENVVTWARTKNARLLIEVKIESSESNLALIPTADESLHAVLEVLRKHDFAEHAIIQSFDLSLVAKAAVEEPQLMRAALFEKITDFATEARRVQAHFVSPLFRLLSKTIVESCHESGLKVVPWTVNSATDWETMLGHGVDGIITDFPRALIEFLRRKNLR